MTKQEKGIHKYTVIWGRLTKALSETDKIKIWGSVWMIWPSQ